MSDLIRDAPVGQLIRFITKNKYLRYPEEKEDFQSPDAYYAGKAVDSGSSPSSTQSSDVVTPIEKAVTNKKAIDVEADLTRPAFAPATQDLERASTLLALHQSDAGTPAERRSNSPIRPEKLADGTILVDWYTTDDPANPQNWTFWKKTLVSMQI